RDVLIDDVLPHLEVRDAIHEHSARLRPEFVHRDRVTLLGEDFRDGEARRPRTDDADLVAGGLGHVARKRVAAELLALVVGAERFELANGYRGLLVPAGPDGEAHNAGALA